MPRKSLRQKKKKMLFYFDHYRADLTLRRPNSLETRLYQDACILNLKMFNNFSSKFLYQTLKQLCGPMFVHWLQFELLIVNMVTILKALLK